MRNVNIKEWLIKAWMSYIEYTGRAKFIFFG